MMRFVKFTLFLCLLSGAFLEADALNDSIAAFPVQERIDSIVPARTGGPRTTPVDVDDNRRRPVLHYYDEHGDPLDEPVMFLSTLDTVAKVKSKPVYPLYNGVNVGVNFGDLIFMAFGQKHASFDVWANVSLHNWFFPTIECGLGFADDTPDKSNFTYRTKPSFYAKVGINYNFLYKSNPDYQVFLGLRAGFSSFTYDVTDVTISSDYWDETQRFSMTGLRSVSLYGEALAGIQVKIAGNFSLGWSARWNFDFHTASDGDSQPWFIPGRGGSSPFSMSVSAIWTIPAPGRRDNVSTSE